MIGPNNIFYGKIAGATASQDVYYAIGDTGYKNNPVSQQDGPHAWRKSGHTWKYLGDTGGMICHKIPVKMVQAWGKSCS